MINQGEMGRRTFMKRLSGAAAGLGVSHWLMAQLATGADTGVSDAPNVVYIFGDTHRYCSLSFTETPGVVMPHMEQMNQQGVSFSHCFSSYPICSPYRAILQTGRWPFQQGVIANHMGLPGRTDGQTRGMLSHMFRDAGYATYFVGKWHLGNNTGYDHGYDKFYLWKKENNTVLSYSEDGKPAEEWTADKGYTGLPERPPYPAQPDYKFKVIGETDHALMCIDNHVNSPRPQKKPFFLMLSVHDPHGPWNNIPKHLTDLYPSEKELPLRKNDRRKDWKWYQQYNAEISGVDEQIGRVLDKLEAYGLTENTIVMYTSDHGGMGGAQDVKGGSKRRPHDESSRVPFLLQWPKQVSGNRTIDTPFTTIDIFPTVCGLAGLPERLKKRDTTAAWESLAYLQDCPGSDLSPELLGTGTVDVDSAFVMHVSDMSKSTSQAPMSRSIITRDYTYAVKTRYSTDADHNYQLFDSAEPWCLYDRKADPLQMNNLVHDPELASVRQTLHKKLVAWIQRAELPYVEHYFSHIPDDALHEWNREHGVKDRGSREEALRAYRLQMDGLLSITSTPRR